jgi:hypothetical protein
VKAFALLGTGAFETISGEVVNVDLSIFSTAVPHIQSEIVCFRADEELTAKDKALALKTTSPSFHRQLQQLENPDARIVFGERQNYSLLSEHASALAGLFAGDSARFNRNFWEVGGLGQDWEFLQSTVEQTQYHGGKSFIVLWEQERGEMFRLAQSVRHLNHAAQNWLRGKPNWGKRGVVISQMGELPATLYNGDRYDTNCCAIVPHDVKILPALWAFCSSGEFPASVRLIDQSIKVTPHTLLKVPFDLPYWESVAAEKYPNGLPCADSNDPTEWLFHGRLSGTTAPLQVALARLLAYRWPRQTGQLVSGATPVADDGLGHLIDEDGIVCIPSVRGEPPAMERVRALLATAYGDNWNPATLDELLKAAHYAGSNLEDWLRNGFFEQHCKLFHQRPFIWHIWDGRKDGFSALVNYHKLDHKLLEKLTYTYLGDWIKRQQDALTNEESGADDRLLKAQQLQDKLKLILEGEVPYDIFVRWKPLEQQPIGWNPDLNDGVRLNIRPFMTADVLRKRPNIKWGIDRGKNPPGSPWGEIRDNDRHLSLEEKRKTIKP